MKLLIWWAAGDPCCFWDWFYQDREPLSCGLDLPQIPPSALSEAILPKPNLCGRDRWILSGEGSINLPTSSKIPWKSLTHVYRQISNFGLMDKGPIYTDALSTQKCLQRSLLSHWSWETRSVPSLEGAPPFYNSTEYTLTSATLDRTKRNDLCWKTLGRRTNIKAQNTFLGLLKQKGKTTEMSGEWFSAVKKRILKKCKTRMHVKAD